jgi:hypothetical protein
MTELNAETSHPLDGLLEPGARDFDAQTYIAIRHYVANTPRTSHPPPDWAARVIGSGDA